MSYGPTMQPPGAGAGATRATAVAAKPPNLGAGVVAGLAAGVAGAFIWGAIGALTAHNWSIVAFGVGILVALAVSKAAGGSGPELGGAAALITVVACLVGDVAAAYFRAAHDLGTSVGNLMNLVGPTRVLSDEVKHQPLSMIFILVGAAYAFRYAATGGNLRGRRTTMAPAAATFPAQPGFAQPGFAHPNFGQPAAQPPQPSPQPAYGQPAYGQPGYGQPGYSQPGYGQPPVQAPPSYGQPASPPPPVYGQPTPPPVYGQPAQPTPPPSDDGGYFANQPPAV